MSEKKLSWEKAVRLGKVQRVSPERTRELREDFENNHKPSLLRDLYTYRQEDLRKLGIPQEDIDAMVEKTKSGKIIYHPPEGWELDHIIPLFLSGLLENPNGSENIMLMPVDIHELKTQYIDNKIEETLRKLGERYEGYPRFGVGRTFEYPFFQFLDPIQVIGKIRAFDRRKCSDIGKNDFIEAGNHIFNDKEYEYAKKNYDRQKIKPRRKIPKVLGWLGPLATVLGVGEEAKAAVTEGKETGQWGEAIGKAVARIGLPLIGSSVGGAAGATLGSLIFPGTGTIAGGLLGMGMGGFFGGIASDRAQELIDRVSQPAPLYKHEYLRAAKAAEEEQLQKEKQRERTEEKAMPPVQGVGIEKVSEQRAEPDKERKEEEQQASQSKRALSVEETVAKIYEELRIRRDNRKVEQKDPEKIIEEIEKTAHPSPFYFYNPNFIGKSMEKRGRER
ncbi:hypothetical protein [Candidatus Methylacidiphilum fumarolicum]|uniref:hypothetical protein n=1 Tax=Candidatus Methylacidiphilum fumarolicum TaxID=591154 RepID=UPI00106AD280|nr:hypothetical protein [Candidatus Methylacidiphilum fumarolicum]TFE77651.1 hypothetical protein A7D33_03745 [Candidatus Methylacidiphilum fumarolicum]